ncbi:MAG TPA: (2Fe-2S)-binding protein [Anaeromyxobacteraceae bacterium]|jgi:bacterioferritin-associated ferredoxin|nr:(2Fe-2S)-binding protein [Anaeromyxobacteraceae bacterium]
MIVCVCRAVSDRQILALAGQGLSSEEVMARTGAGTCCGSCRPAVTRLVMLGRPRAEGAPAEAARQRDAA